MQTPDILHQMKAEMLDPNDYFSSLVRQAGDCGLLSEKEWSAIQTDLFLVFAGQADRWSRGKSSSIPAEKAQDMMASILFVMGIQLKSCQTPEQAVDCLKTESLKSLFEKGLCLVRRKVAVSRQLQKRILNHLLDTPNVYYRSTIADGIQGFFKLYRPQFAAHKIHITADYPVLIGRPRLKGIEFIEQYLRCIHAENAFCMQFAPQDIHHLLCGLTQDYRSVPLNIFEPVLLSALGLTMRQRNPKRLDLTKQDVAGLYQLFWNQSEKAIRSRLEKALSDLQEIMDLPPVSVRYALLCMPRLTVTVRNAVSLNTLDKVFLVPACPGQDSPKILSYGERMRDNEYQKLVERILQMDSSEEKVTLILNEVHSLADLLDVLSDTELCAEEFDLLINRLPLPAFAMLLLQYPDDDFLSRESEQLLFAALQKRKQRLTAKEAQQIFLYTKK